MIFITLLAALPQQGVDEELDIVGYDDSTLTSNPKEYVAYHKYEDGAYSCRVNVNSFIYCQSPNSNMTRMTLSGILPSGRIFLGQHVNSDSKFFIPHTLDFHGDTICIVSRDGILICGDVDFEKHTIISTNVMLVYGVKEVRFPTSWQFMCVLAMNPDGTSSLAILCSNTDFRVQNWTVMENLKNVNSISVIYGNDQQMVCANDVENHQKCIDMGQNQFDASFGTLPTTF
eukprot:NODE_177_length_14091_cov_0.996141.p6 type:complete len:230 gc:universal NODE_177_length_14091_cov_0.996141:9777-9088(-)